MVYLNIILTIIVGVIISMVWFVLGLKLVQYLELSEPKNTRQNMICSVLMGPFMFYLVNLDYISGCIKKIYSTLGYLNTILYRFTIGRLFTFIKKIYNS